MTNLLAHQTLIFDADDTLWECNKYFEDAITEFIAFLHHEHLTPGEVRQVIDSFERVNGYGAEAFARSLVETYRKLATENDPGEEDVIERLGLRILDQEMETIPGVEQTLTSLQPHHQLILCTKGEEQEQQLKLTRSPLTHFFEHTIIVHDKTVETYREIAEGLNFEPSTTWMIGNSLRSDIYPALEAGLNAIYVPNPHTWHMEHMEFGRADHWPGQWLEVESISQLLNHFVADSAGHP